MSDFNFPSLSSSELMPSEELACIDQAVNLSELLFGSVKDTSKRDSKEAVLSDGRYARLSRLVVRKETGYSLAIDCNIFMPNNEEPSTSLSVDGETGEESEGIVYMGESFDFNFDTEIGEMHVTNSPAAFIIDHFGDGRVHLDPDDIMNDAEFEENGERSPTFQDQTYLMVAHDILLS